MSDDLVISGDEFHARDLEQPAVIRTPFLTTTCYVTSLCSSGCGDIRPAL